MAFAMDAVDYTAAGNPDSLDNAPFTTYRFMHWLVDIMRNFMSDPVNVRDTRLSSILGLSGGGEACAGLFKVGPAYSDNDRKAGTTPAIIVSAGPLESSLQGLNSIPVRTALAHSTIAAGNSFDMRSITLTVSVVTESYDGTVLLADALFEFLTGLQYMQRYDWPALSTLGAAGIGAVQAIQCDQAGNAKQAYQAQITVRGIGAASIARSSEGPVFRGISMQPVDAAALRD